MTTLSIAAAARAAGVSRTTIYDRINEGDLSRAPGGGIDPTELMRVFGALCGAGDIRPDPTPHATAEGKADITQEIARSTRHGGPALSSGVQLDNSAAQRDVHLIENERWLRELVDQQRTEIGERNRELQTLRAEKEEAVREAEARAERREATWQRQIDVLTGLLPAPPEAAGSPEPEPEPEPKRGFLGRLFS